MGKVFCIDLGATLSVKSLIPVLLTALTSAECTLSAAGLEIEAKFDAIIEDFERFFLFAVSTNMHKQNVKKKSRKHAHKQCQKSIKLPARIAASVSQSIENFVRFETYQNMFESKTRKKNCIE